MVQYEIRLRRRSPWLRRLLAVLSWIGVLLVVALAVPTPLGPARLGVTVVSGPSMLPTYEPQDLLVTWHRADYPVGTPVVYAIPEGDAGAGLNVIHRIVAVNPDGTHVTQGDNNGRIDPWRPRVDDVKGAVVVRIPQGGRWLRIVGSPLVLAVACGILTTAALLRRRGDRDPPDRLGPPYRRRPRGKHRAPTIIRPPLPRSVALGAAIWLAVATGTSHAADLDDLHATELHASVLPAELAVDPVSYEQTLTSETASSYCATVVVTNHSSSAVQWEVALDVSDAPYDAASITSSYNVTTVSFTASVWRVRGVDWNAALGAGQSYEWGYCANRPVGGLTDLPSTVSITQDNAGEYCATVTVSTSSTAWVRWRTTLDRTTPGLTAGAYRLASVPSTYSNATSISFEAGSWVVRGVGHNEYVRAGSPATFSYCAPPGAGADLVEATVSVAVHSSGGGQYCATVTVSTTSPTWVRWRATIDHTTAGVTSASYWLAAQPTTYSGAVAMSFTPATGSWVLRGQAYNQTIRAEAPQTWSYCAPVNTDVLTDATVSAHVTSSGAWGFCADVTVTNPTSGVITWRATIRRSTPGLTAPSHRLTSQPGNVWGATSISFAGATGTWVLKGASYNAVLQPNASTTFGFCKQ